MADGHVPGYEIKTVYKPTVGGKPYLLDTRYLPGPEQTIRFIVTMPLDLNGSEPLLLRDGGDRGGKH
jgi:hypothetical protein